MLDGRSLACPCLSSVCLSTWLSVGATRKPKAIPDPDPGRLSASSEPWPPALHVSLGLRNAGSTRRTACHCTSASLSLGSHVMLSASPSDSGPDRCHTSPEQSALETARSGQDRPGRASGRHATYSRKAQLATVAGNLFAHHRTNGAESTPPPLCRRIVEPIAMQVESTAQSASAEAVAKLAAPRRRHPDLSPHELSRKQEWTEPRLATASLGRDFGPASRRRLMGLRHGLYSLESGGHGPRAALTFLCMATGPPGSMGRSELEGHWSPIHALCSHSVPIHVLAGGRSAFGGGTAEGRGGDGHGAAHGEQRRVAKEQTTTRTLPCCASMNAGVR
ncbi:uncharacterized protein PSFLO_05408 [Pseudozyma flocculosa]|uniref:Uncharacterized protein n=1 Tax=Pseudozyma flocculosa TaxID=84751 RepID=A0A5C3F874_9BASI|nr:uncharacterized protein PSFLO_05408 [Pseudozyma flocculosa]